METISSPVLIIAVAAVLGAGVMAYVLLRKRPASRIAAGTRQADGSDKAHRTNRVLRILVIIFAGMSLLFIAHLIIKDKETILFLLAHEVGFALIVSLVVWALFEAQLSQEAEKTWDQRVERVTQNVFQAVLRKDLPKELLDEANNLVLNTSLIRSGFTVTYTLSDTCFELEPGTDVECVVLEALMEFTMQNVSTDDVCWTVALLLPNPVHGGMKRLVEVRSLAVTKGGEAVSLDLDQARSEFETQLQDNRKTAVTFSPGEVLLRPGESCEFSASYVMAKESEDTELLSTRYPADGLRVTIFDSAGDKKRITFARSVHRQDVESVSAGDSGNAAKIFRIPGYLLPHQGVLIWWKRRPS